MAAFQSALRQIDGFWRWAGRPAGVEDKSHPGLKLRAWREHFVLRTDVPDKAPVMLGRYPCEAAGWWRAQVESAVRAGLYGRFRANSR